MRSLDIYFQIETSGLSWNGSISITQQDDAPTKQGTVGIATAILEKGTNNADSRSKKSVTN